jgi:hypothetical protein
LAAAAAPAASLAAATSQTHYHSLGESWKPSQHVAAAAAVERYSQLQQQMQQPQASFAASQCSAGKG